MLLKFVFDVSTGAIRPSIMEPRVQEVLQCFDSIKLETLRRFVEASDREHVERIVMNLIVQGKLRDFRIDGDHVVKITDEPVIANLLRKLQRIEGSW